MKLLERKLNTMPLDKAFDTENGRELCHATGIEVYFGEDSDGKNSSDWWNEYEDSFGNFHYGR